VPEEKREEIECKDDLFEYLRQSHISEENVSRLKKLAATPIEQKAKLVGIVLEGGEIKPYKKRRPKELASKKRDFLDTTRRPFHGPYFNSAKVQY
jgi:hypothetical protein